MSRTLRWVLTAAIVEMTLVAAWLVFTRWQGMAADGQIDAAAQAKLLRLGLGMAFFPAWIGLFSLLIRRKLGRPGLIQAPDTRRYHETTWIAVTALAVAVQGWTAAMALGAVTHDDQGLRIIEALTGFFIMVVGNFAAKTSPPTGERAPDPAAWTRGMLRIGWLGVANGLVIIVAAIVVPVSAMAWVVIGASATYALAAAWQRRIMHRKPA